jgi:hypothetical protein
VPSKYISFAGRKLVAMVFCTSCMVLTAIGTLSMTALHALDGGFSENLTITVVGGICTLYATFVGGNYGEHVAKSRVGAVQAQLQSNLSGSTASDKSERSSA